MDLRAFDFCKSLIIFSRNRESELSKGEEVEDGLQHLRVRRAGVQGMWTKLVEKIFTFFVGVHKNGMWKSFRF